MKKKMKYRRRQNMGKRLRKMKRRALRGARKGLRTLAYVGSGIFILFTTFMALIYSLKFEPNVAMAWITASMIGTLQGWLLLSS